MSSLSRGFFLLPNLKAIKSENGKKSFGLLLRGEFFFWNLNGHESEMGKVK